MSKPSGLFMVTDAGQRIPIDVKLSHIDEDRDVRYWAPIIEADLNAVMPSVVAFDGPCVDKGECLTFQAPGPGWNTAEWAERIMANSRHVFGWYEPGVPT